MRMQSESLMNGRPRAWPRLATRLGAPVAMALLLAACSVVPKDSPEAGRAKLSLPVAQAGGQWVDLGGGEESLDSLDPTLPAPTLPTRVVGLRGADQSLLAVMVVQSNRSGLWPDRQAVRNACPPERGVLVEDATAASPTRTDCLRYKRWADGYGWLASRYPKLNAYLDSHQSLPVKPFGALDFRYNTEGGGYVLVQVLANRRLTEPVTRGNSDFLVAGRPAEEWARKVAQAARLSAASLDGALNLPDFPMALPK